MLLSHDFDSKGWKNPGAHISHFVWEVADAVLLMYLPAGHEVCAVHESVLVLLFDVEALKNPGGHLSHLGCQAAEPADFV